MHFFLDNTGQSANHREVSIYHIGSAMFDYKNGGGNSRM